MLYWQSCCPETINNGKGFPCSMSSASISHIWFMYCNKRKYGWILGTHCFDGRSADNCRLDVYEKLCVMLSCCNFECNDIWCLLIIFFLVIN